MEPRAPRLFEPARSVLAAVTFNFGPRTATLPHIDLGNLAWGWCFITTLGWSNPDLGGHLILWDLCLIIWFPPGCSIAIPSAIIRHSNTPIQPDPPLQHPHPTRRDALLPCPVHCRGQLQICEERLRNQCVSLSDAEKKRRQRVQEERFSKGVKMWARVPRKASSACADASESDLSDVPDSFLLAVSGFTGAP
ncbi:hypothetical protein GGX14DRAFT_568544 [Mycena pura]|uniref:Uncharacterized protein n=1 Tax=Mycena pura TaxID=153505 RepID=A0AAD6VAZ9_9AGAR|nr:hypothetical protein GGX14DRAFT_568544 [Mycena pura]